jgi:hypothetical protein
MEKFEKACSSRQRRIVGGHVYASAPKNVRHRTLAVL